MQSMHSSFSLNFAKGDEVNDYLDADFNDVSKQIEQSPRQIEEVTPAFRHKQSAPITLKEALSDLKL